jgi:hypothetical protein
MSIVHPHLLHLMAYSILTALAVKISLRMFLTIRLSGLVVHDAALKRSKVRLIELLSLEAIQVSPLEAGVLVIAHLMLLIGSGVLFLIG